MAWTVNELLVAKNALMERRNALSRLSGQCIRRSKRTYLDRNEKEVTELDQSRFDVEDVEAKIADVSEAIFNIDRSIKMANAKTQVEIELDVNDLMRPVKPRPWED